MTKLRNMTSAAPERRKRKGLSVTALFVTVVIGVAAALGASFLSSRAGHPPLLRVALTLPDKGPAIRLGDWPVRYANGEPEQAARRASQSGR